VLSGRVNPSGRLPVQVPRHPGGQPTGYLHPRLDAPSGVTAADTAPAYGFGHGLSYTSFDYSGLEIDPEMTTEGEITIGCTVRNTGARAGTEVVQLYLHDPVASTARPVRQLAGFARVELESGGAARVRFRLHADRTAFAGRSAELIVEPGVVEVQIGSSSVDLRLSGSVRLTGPTRVVGHDRVLHTPVTVQR
jgi:beta-xylosidase